MEKTVIIFVFLFNVFATAPGNDGLLQKTDYLKDKAFFINCDSSLRYLDVSKNKEFSSGPGLFSGTTPSVPGAPIAVLPDNTFYVGTFKYILKFDNNFLVVDEKPIDRFGLNEKIHSFIGQAEASVDHIWILVYEKSTQKNDTFFVMEWDTALDPNTAKFSPKFKEFCHWAIDKDKRVLYVPGEETIVYNFSSGNTETSRGNSRTVSKNC